MNRRIYGEHVDHSVVSSTLGCLGLLEQDRGRSESASKYLHECASIQERIFGKDEPHPALAKTYGNLGNFSLTRGYLEEAEKFYRKALKLERVFYGPSEPVALKIRQLAGVLLQMKKNLPEVFELYRESLEMEQKLYQDGIKYIGVDIALDDLVHLVQEYTGRLVDELEELYRQNLNIVRRKKEADPKDFNSAIRKFPGVMKEKKNYKEAKKL